MPVQDSAYLSRVIEISQRRHVCAYEVGVIYIGLGEKDEAFRWLEKGLRDRSACIWFDPVPSR